MKRLVEAVRAWLHARAKVRVLVLGDSHVRVFEHWLFLLAMPRTAFEVEYVAGGTASGMGNRKSISGAYRRFSERLASSPHDLVLLNLGEVDTAYTIWRRADLKGIEVETMFEAAVQHYLRFIDEVAPTHRLIVLSAPLPTLADQAINPDPEVKMRQEVSASQLDRTRLAQRFNSRISAFCAERGIPYLSSDAAALGPDGVVRSSWCRRDRPDHHYARLPYAWWLLRALRGLRHPAGVLLR
jgi:hypothetical protein